MILKYTNFKLILIIFDFFSHIFHDETKSEAYKWLGLNYHQIIIVKVNYITKK